MQPLFHNGGDTFESVFHMCTDLEVGKENGLDQRGAVDDKDLVKGRGGVVRPLTSRTNQHDAEGVSR